MVKTLAFKKIKLFNHFPAILKAVTVGRDNLDDSVKKYVATVRMIARRSMRKAPNKPKSRFGNLKAFSSLRKYGQYYWQKGEFSRPGHPPFHHGNPNPGRSLKNIIFTHIGNNKYEVGPSVLSGTKYDVPALHEYGGSVAVSTFPYRTKRGMVRRRPGRVTAIYPKRPYMLPAMIKAKYEKRGTNRSFINRQNSIAGMTPSKRAM